VHRGLSQRSAPRGRRRWCSPSTSTTQGLPDADVEAEARAYAQKLAAGPTVAYRYAKALINTAAAHGAAAADLLAMEATPQTFDTEDMRNATKRFAELGRAGFRDGLEFKGR
jgi:enoyl-CoA hydratase/carnithine racemase